MFEAFIIRSTTKFTKNPNCLLKITLLQKALNSIFTTCNTASYIYGNASKQVFGYLKRFWQFRTYPALTWDTNI